MHKGVFSEALTDTVWSHPKKDRLVHDVTTMCPHLSMLKLSSLGSSLIFAFFFSSSSFCVCEDANVTHKSFYCKEEKKLLDLFAILLWYLLLSPHVMENRQHSKVRSETQMDSCCG